MYVAKAWNAILYQYVVLKNRYGPSRNDMMYISHINECISNDIIYSYISMFI